MAADILKYFDLAKYFTIICGAISDGSRNTKEAVIEHLLSQLDTLDNLVMVGDTIYDVKGANFHHIPCIAVSWGYGMIEEMTAAGATIVNTTDELYQLLQ
jgi:phosphoglycolate phosphatase